VKKAALIVLIVIEIVGGVVSFLGLLISNWIVALISLPFLALGVIPWLVLLDHMDQIEQLYRQVSLLQTKVHFLEKEMLSSEEGDESDLSYVNPNGVSSVSASSRWECVKCGAVNRANTSVCENCGARFSSEQKQIFSAPLTKWKIMKEKKKR